MIWNVNSPTVTSDSEAASTAHSVSSLFYSSVTLLFTLPFWAAYTIQCLSFSLLLSPLQSLATIIWDSMASPWLSLTLLSLSMLTVSQCSMLSLVCAPEQLSSCSEQPCSVSIHYVSIAASNLKKSFVLGSILSSSLLIFYCNTVIIHYDNHSGPFQWIQHILCTFPCPNLKYPSLWKEMNFKNDLHSADSAIQESWVVLLSLRGVSGVGYQISSFINYIII